jgi:hypothetical protein
MNFNDIMRSVKVTYDNTCDSEMYGATASNTTRIPIDIENDLWNWKPGSLTLAAREELILSVNYGFRETTIDDLVDPASKITHLDYFRRVTDYVLINYGSEVPHIKLLGGKTKIIDDNTVGKKAQP